MVDHGNVAAVSMEDGEVAVPTRGILEVEGEGTSASSADVERAVNTLRAADATSSFF